MEIREPVFVGENFQACWQNGICRLTPGNFHYEASTFLQFFCSPCITLSCTGMLIVENFISRYENFTSPDSSSTRIWLTLTHAAETTVLHNNAQVPLHLSRRHVVKLAWHRGRRTCRGGLSYTALLSLQQACHGTRKQSDLWCQLPHSFPRPTVLAGWPLIWAQINQKSLPTSHHPT